MRLRVSHFGACLNLVRQNCASRSQTRWRTVPGLNRQAIASLGAATIRPVSCVNSRPDGGKAKGLGPSFPVLQHGPLAGQNLGRGRLNYRRVLQHLTL